MKTMQRETAIMQTAIDSMNTDKEYLWGWWCNLVMSMIDSDIERQKAETATYRFICTLKGVSSDPTLLRMWTIDRLRRQMLLLKDEIDSYDFLLENSFIDRFNLLYGSFKFGWDMVVSDKHLQDAEELEKISRYYAARPVYEKIVPMLARAVTSIYVLHSDTLPPLE